ncbi:MAG: RibD family protein [Hyphomicrobium sp.]
MRASPPCAVTLRIGPFEVIAVASFSFKANDPFMPPQPPHPVALSDPLRNAPADKTYVIAQLGQSLDGRIATQSGESRWINGPAALTHLHRLRSLVDAVVIGCGTAIADDPQLTVRRVVGRNPARVVIDPNGRAPAAARIFADDGVRRLVVRGAPGPAPAGVEAVCVALTNGVMKPVDIVAALFNRGLRKILVEGGASTVSRFIDDGVVDRLHILQSPIILGSGVAGLSLAPIIGLDGALRPEVRAHILDDGNVVFDCNLRQPSEG